MGQKTIQSHEKGSERKGVNNKFSYQGVKNMVIGGRNCKFNYARVGTRTQAGFIECDRYIDNAYNIDSNKYSAEEKCER